MTASFRLEVFGEGKEGSLRELLIQAVKLKPVADMGTDTINNRWLQPGWPSSSGSLLVYEWGIWGSYINFSGHFQTICYRKQGSQFFASC